MALLHALVEAGCSVIVGHLDHSLREGSASEAIFVSAAAKKLGVEAGKTVKVSFDGVKGEAVVRIDETISAGVALVPRSMGLAIREPVAVKVK